MLTHQRVDIHVGGALVAATHADKCVVQIIVEVHRLVVRGGDVHGQYALAVEVELLDGGKDGCVELGGRTEHGDYVLLHFFRETEAGDFERLIFTLLYFLDAEHYPAAVRV